MDKDKFSIDDLALEPLEPTSNELPTTHNNRSGYQTDLRKLHAGDRRMFTDRRNEIRFQAERRLGKDRRAAQNIWDRDHAV